jgi:hypothetical protein
VGRKAVYAGFDLEQTERSAITWPDLTD